MILIYLLLFHFTQISHAGAYVDSIKARNEALIEADKTGLPSGPEKKNKINSLIREKMKAATSKRVKKKKPSLDNFENQVKESIKQATTASKQTDPKTPTPEAIDKKTGKPIAKVPPIKDAKSKEKSTGIRMGTTGPIGEAGGAEELKFK